MHSWCLTIKETKGYADMINTRNLCNPMYYPNGLRKIWTGLCLASFIGVSSSSSTSGILGVSALQTNPSPYWQPKSALPEPPREDDIVILIIGGKGTGKSSFVNAIANYLGFYKGGFRDVINVPQTVLIPYIYTLLDKDSEPYKSYRINSNVGDQVPSEAFVPVALGTSAETKDITDYKIAIPGTNRNLILIDTPGYSNIMGRENDINIPCRIKQFMRERKIRRVDYVALVMASGKKVTDTAMFYLDRIFQDTLPGFNTDSIRIVITQPVHDTFMSTANYERFDTFYASAQETSYTFANMPLRKDNLIVIDNACISSWAVIRHSGFDPSNRENMTHHNRRGATCWEHSRNVVNRMIMRMLTADHVPYFLPSASR